MKIVVTHQQDGTDVRVGKLCRSLSKVHDVTYLGWNRDQLAVEPDLGGAQRELFDTAGRPGLTRVASRVGFAAWAYRRLRALRPEVVIAVNEELAFLLAPARLLLGFRLILDIHDPVADRMRSRTLARAMLAVQHGARRFADKLIVTDQNRYDRLLTGERKRSVILPNYPNRDYLSVNNLPSLTDNIVRIAVVGSLHSSRGLTVLHEAAAQAGNCALELAGWIGDAKSGEITRSPIATFHGVVGLQQSLAIAANCDLIFCFYDPSVTNNVNASPNKIYEAICLGKKSIINSECVVSAWVVDQGFGYTCAYNDVAGLRAIIEAVRIDLAAHRKADQAIKAVGMSRFVWEAHEEHLFATLTDSASGPASGMRTFWQDI